GASGLNGLVKRGAKVTSTERMLDSTNNIRYAQARYDATGESAQIGEIERQANEIISTVEKTKGTYSQPNDVQRLDSIAAEVREYQRGFQAMVALREAKIATRASWVEVGNVADAAIAQLELGLVGTPASPILPEDAASALLALRVTDLGKQARLLRYAVRG